MITLSMRYAVAFLCLVLFVSCGTSQVKVENEGDAEETFSTLMGDIVEPRRDFIQSNALNSNIDT